VSGNITLIIVSVPARRLVTEECRSEDLQVWGSCFSAGRFSH